MPLRRSQLPHCARAHSTSDRSAEAQLAYGKCGEGEAQDQGSRHASSSSIDRYDALRALRVLGRERRCAVPARAETVDHSRACESFSAARARRPCVEQPNVVEHAARRASRRADPSPCRPCRAARRRRPQVSSVTDCRQ